ncbi:DNA-binding protein [Bacillus cereus]|nr:APC family permease [Bacillus thuringiensis]OPD43723.1 DNA-binding protein [Bacillus cereus]
MKPKSAYVVLAVGVIFVFAAILRFFGYSTPSLVVALISLIAALISFSDILEITRYKKIGTISQIFALIFFILAIIIWLFQFNLEYQFIQTIGDSFTILGLGLVIGLYGFKEILDNKNIIEKSNPSIEYIKFKITLNEYEEMMKLNDIMERLKKLDQDTFPYNRVHNGWAFFYDSLHEHLVKWHGPFFDGMNREKYDEFLWALNNATDKIGNIADPDYIIGTRKVEMWNEFIELTIQKSIHNAPISSMNDIKKEMTNVQLKWNEFKDLVNNRYEKERAEQQVK